MAPPAYRRTNFILIQKVSIDGDDRYGDVETWTEFTRAWVSLDPVRGNEHFVGEQREARTIYNVRGDFLELKGVTELMRIVHSEAGVYGTDATPCIPDDAKVYDIIAVLPDEDMHGDIMLKVHLEPKSYGSLVS